MHERFRIVLPADEEMEETHKRIEATWQSGPNQNSALIWFPAIRDAGLPVPRTEFVEFHPDMLWPLLDGKSARDNFPMDNLKAACERIGYPVFIRSDLSSAKHAGPRSFRADSIEDLWRCVSFTFDDNACKDLASWIHAWMVREWIPIVPIFTAFGGLNIGREWRFFADQNGWKCEHFYWPEEAFQYETLTADQRRMRNELSEQKDDIPTLRDMAVAASRSIGEGSWSVDFAQDANGKWWLIDMARAESSWHPYHDADTNAEGLQSQSESDSSTTDPKDKRP